MSNQIPTGWKKAIFGQLAEVQGGYAFKTPDFNATGKNAVIRMSNLKSGAIDLSEAKYVHDDVVKKLNHFKLNPGDFLFGMSGSLDNFGWMSSSHGTCYLNQRVGRLKPHPFVNPKFAAYIFLSAEVRNEVLMLAAGAAQLNISPSQLESISILVPPLPEQQKIAAILTSVDKVIESTQAQISKLKDLKTGMMQELLTKGIGHTEFKDSPVGRIPKEWEVVKLTDYIEKIYSGWSPVCEARERVGDEWGILKTTAVVWSGYDPRENKVLASHHEFIENAKVQNGDILVTRKGPRERVGVSVYVHSTPENLMVPDTVFRVLIKKSPFVSAEYIALALSSEYVQLDWDRKKVGLAEAQVNINHQTFDTTYIAMPPKDEQSKICSFFNASQKHINELEIRLSSHQLLKKGLMQDLLTGKVRVKVS